jgi:hypothetical protein
VFNLDCSIKDDIDEALEHAEAHLRVVGDTHTHSDATQRLHAVEHWLMMRIMFGQLRACASAASFIQARDISSLARTSKKSARAASAILPRPRPSCSRAAAASSSDRARPAVLSIFLVGASNAGRLR